MRRALIVEDDEVSAQILSALLEDDFKCDIAPNGEEGLKMYDQSFEKDPYDIIFLDIMMPIKDGQELLKDIRNLEKSHEVQKDQKVKIVMTTALGDFDNVAEAFKGKCDGYLVKPIIPEKLTELLEQLGVV